MATIPNSLLRTLSKIPTPVFGTVATGLAWGSKKASALPRVAPWGLPAFAGVMWFVWPAVDDEWKIGMGLLPDPEAAKEAAAAAAPAAPVELSNEATEKVMTAHIPHDSEAKMTDEEKAVVKAVAAGDFSELEKEWDNFTAKTMNPEDDDDDDDDDDDEDDDDEEEEEEDDEE